MSSEVKTEQNWLFSISALRLLFELGWPFSFTPFTAGAAYIRGLVFD